MITSLLINLSKSVTVVTCIQEVLGSNLGGSLIILTDFIILLNPSRWIPEVCLTSYTIHNSLPSSHSTKIKDLSYWQHR